MDPILLHRLRVLRRAILLGVVAGTPLVVSIGVTEDPYNVPKFAWILTGTGIAAGIRLIELAGGVRTTGWRTPLLPAAAVGLPLVVAWFASPFREWSTMGSHGRYLGLVPYLVVILLAILVADSFDDGAAPIAWALVSAGAIVGAYAFLQILGLDPLGRLFAQAPITTAISTIGNTNFVGGFLAIALSAAVVLWGTSRGVPRYLAVGAIVLMAEGLVFSFSEGGYAAALAGCSLAAGGLSRRRWPRAPAVGAVGAGLAAAALIAVVLIAAARPELPLGVTARIRGYWWGAAVRMAAESPIVGRGPNAFAIEGTAYRTMEDVLTTPYETPDNPHSVFFNLLSGAGVLGGLGFLVAAGSTLRRGFSSAEDPIALALTAATTAYVVQSLVSVDVLTLRVGFWTCVGAIAAIAAGRKADPAEATATTRPAGRLREGTRRSALLLLAAAVAIGATGWAVRFVIADAQVRNGSALFRNHAVAAAQQQFEAALSFREERIYRLAYAEKLGFAALDQELRDPLVVGEALSQFDKALELPDFRAYARYGKVLHYWGTFDERYAAEAVDQFRRAIELNPYNAPLRVDAAEPLLRLGRVSEALDIVTLEGRVLGPQIGEVWASISMANTLRGDFESAAGALDLATERAPKSCTTLIAGQLLGAHRDLEVVATRDDLLTLQLACPRGDYQLLVDLAPSQLRDRYDV